MNDLNSLVKEVTSKAYEIANMRGRLPERINVETSFDMDYSGRLTLNRSHRFPGAINVKMEFAPQAAPPALRLMGDYLASNATKGRKKKTQKQTNHFILYRRQGGYCAGCSHYFQSRNLTIDHVTPISKGGSSNISNLQLLCHACNQLKGAESQEYLMIQLQMGGYLNRGLNFGH